MEDYIVQIVEHVNHVGYVKANSQEEAEEIAAADTSKVDWTRMDGTNHAEVLVAGSEDEYWQAEMG